MEKRRTRLPLLAVLAVALAAVIGFAPKTAWAVEVNNAESLKTELAAADGDEAVTLTGNVELTESLSVAGAKTLDLNGKSITGKCDVLINVPAESVLTIRDSEDGTGLISGGAGQSGAALEVAGTLNLESGSIKSTNAASPVAITGESAELNMTGGAIINESTWSRSELPVLQGVSARDGADVNISGGTVDAPNPEGCGVRAYGSDVALSGSGVISGYYGLFLFNDNNDNTFESKPSSFNMTDGTIDCTVYAIGGNNTSSAGCEATIWDGVIKSSDEEVCVYWPMEGRLTISGGTFTGGTALEIKMGELNISGGTFKSRDAYMSVFNGGSAYEDGSALKIVGQQYGASEGQYIVSPSLKVDITGGEFSSVHGNAISVYSLDQTVDISGRTLTTDVMIGDNAVLSSADGRDAVRVLSKNDFTPESGIGVKTSKTTIKYASLANAAAVADGTTNTNAGGGIEAEEIKTLFTSLANATASSDDAKEPISKITLLRDVDEDVTIPAGADVAIDLGTHDLSGTINNEGKLSLTAAKDNGGSLIGQVIGSGTTSGIDTITVAVAQIGDKTYSTIADAIKAAGNQDTIVLLADVHESIIIPADKTITLDLAGFALTNGTDSDTISNYGTLVVKDSEGTGVVDNLNHGKAAINNYTTGVATLNGGTFRRSMEAGTAGDANGNNSYYYTIRNKGMMTLNAGVTVESLLSDGSFSKLSSVICNGFRNPDELEEYQGKNPTLVIDGATIRGGLYVKNDYYGVIDMRSGDVMGSSAGIFNYGTATISGGTVSVERADRYAVWNYAKEDKGGNPADLTITGGTFNATGENQSAVHQTVNDQFCGTIAISGGTFNGAITADENAPEPNAGIAISGGTFDHQPAAEYLAEGFVPNKLPGGGFGVHKHTLVEHPAKAPTCTEAGNIRYWQCSVCGAQFTDTEGTTPVTCSVELEATGHELKRVPAREATADAKGNVEFWYCSTCGDIFLDGAATKPATLDDVLVPATGEQPVVKHTVTLVYGTGKTETVEVANGALLAMPETPTYDGYTFLAWYTDEGLTQEYDFSTPVTGDLTLYAGWLPAGQQGGGGPVTTPEQKPAADEKNDQLAQTSDPTSLVPVAVAGAAGVSALAGALVARRRQR